MHLYTIEGITKLNKSYRIKKKSLSLNIYSLYHTKLPDICSLKVQVFFVSRHQILEIIKFTSDKMRETTINPFPVDFRIGKESSSGLTAASASPRSHDAAFYLDIVSVSASNGAGRRWKGSCRVATTGRRSPTSVSARHDSIASVPSAEQSGTTESSSAQLENVTGRI